MHLYTRLVIILIICLGYVSNAFAGYQTYTVKEGDTLTGIANEYYSAPGWYTEIQRVSCIHDADWIFVEQVILIPDVGGDTEENCPGIDKIVALNTNDEWIARVLRNPRLIDHLTNRKPQIEKDYIIEPAIPKTLKAEVTPSIIPFVEIQIDSLENFESAIPSLKLPQAPSVSTATKPDQKPVIYAPHLNWSNIIQGLEEYPEKPSSKDKKKKKNPSP